MPTAITRRKTFGALRWPMRHERAGNCAAIEVKIRMRHAVADAALGDELGEPHDDAGTGGHA